MALKRISYVPTAETLADLPDPASFQVGTVFWVQAQLSFYYTNGTTWVEVP